MKNAGIEYFIAERAFDQVNGDIGFVEECGSHFFIGLIDGLGHGPEAHNIALISQKFLKENLANERLDETMKGLHGHIRGSRGCVAAICSINVQSLQIRYSGIGNIALIKLGASPQRGVLAEGVIGYSISAPKVEAMQLSRGDVLILASDGLESRIDINSYPKILDSDPETIATNILEKFGRDMDDQLCIVLRCT